MVVTVFRSRLRPEAGDEYLEVAERMESLARSMPGFVDFKAFSAADGERVSLIAFESMEAQAAWRNHPEHREAQRRGRERFYAEYRIQVCDLQSERCFDATG
jgi:heme-degrading monooxygenase HmoA